MQPYHPFIKHFSTKKDRMYYFSDCKINHLFPPEDHNGTHQRTTMFFEFLFEWIGSNIQQVHLSEQQKILMFTNFSQLKKQRTVSFQYLRSSKGDLVYMHLSKNTGRSFYFTWLLIARDELVQIQLQITKIQLDQDNIATEEFESSFYSKRQLANIVFSHLLF